MNFRVAILLLALGIVLSGCAGSNRGSTARQASRYSHRMHNRFYEAWVPPASLNAPHGKLSAPADITIDKDGRVRSFNLAKSSGYAPMDESILQVGRRIKRVAPPPETSRNDRFRLRVFFELDVKR